MLVTESGVQTDNLGFNFLATLVMMADEILGRRVVKWLEIQMGICEVFGRLLYVENKEFIRMFR